jgi:hypothetical protein
MPRSSQAPEPWHSFLVELAREATEETHLDCMGGFVVTILYGLPRATSDLDVLLIAPREQRAPLLELGVRGGALTSICGFAPSILTTWRYQSSNETSSGIATTLSTWLTTSRLT